MKNRSSRQNRSSDSRSSSHRSSSAARGPSRGASTGRGSAPAREPEIPKSWRAVAGTHALRELLSTRPAEGVPVVWLRQGWESSEDLRQFEELARSKRIKIEVKPPAALERLCATHQGAIGFASSRPRLDYDGLDGFATSVILALDGLEDPHNLGAILRTSWLTGAHGLLVPADRAVGLTATAHKVACGGAEHVPVEEVNQFAPSIEKLKEKGYWVFGLSHKATKSLFDFKLPEKIVWAIGAEDKGLRGTTERLCDELVSIPQLSAAASYNASVATAMALTETLRQHRHRQ